jgi:hypothetical protein
VTDDDRQLRDEIRALADRFEADAEPEEQVTARIERRGQPWLAPAVGLVTVLAVVLVIGIGLRPLLPGYISDEPPATPVGLYRSQLPDANGQCVAIRLYDTTSTDKRVALWVWAGTDGCAARRSNLTMGEGTISGVQLPRGDGPDRSAVWVEASPDAVEPLAGLVFVIDAAEASGQDLPGYWSLDEVTGTPTLILERVEELSVPYQPE